MLLLCVCVCVCVIERCTEWWVRCGVIVCVLFSDALSGGSDLLLQCVCVCVIERCTEWRVSCAVIVCVCLCFRALH